MIEIVPSLFDCNLSDAGSRQIVTKQAAVDLFIFFKQHPVFNWESANNGCEGRADAICVLLEAWGIPNYKAWAFGGAFLKDHVGQLKQNWKYHVAPVLSVMEDGEIIDYAIDPSSGNALKNIADWAADITALPHSYFCVRQSHWYIFPAKDISRSKWNTRNRQNRKWMIQCLAGINSLTATGRATLSFNKPRIENKAAAFEKLKMQGFTHTVN